MNRQKPETGGEKQTGKKPSGSQPSTSTGNPGNPSDVENLLDLHTKAKELDKKTKLRNGRLMTAKETSENQKVVQDLAIESVTDQKRLADGQSKIVLNAAEKNARDQLARSQTPQKLHSLDSSNRRASVTEAHKRAAEIARLKKLINTQKGQLQQHVMMAFKDHFLALDNSCHLVEVLLKEEMSKPANNDTAASRRDRFEQLCNNYDKDRQAIAGEFTEEMAKTELAKMKEDRYYVAHLPPGDFDDWNGREAWGAVLRLFLDIVKYQLVSEEKNEDRPADYSSWTGKLKKFMKDYVLPFFEANELEIILLGAANPEKSEYFAKTLDADSNRTFNDHYIGNKSVTHPLAYSARYYIGIIKALYILKNMHKNVEEIPNVVPVNGGVAEEPWTRQGIMDDICKGLQMSLEAEDNDAVRAAADQIISSLYHASNNNAEVHSNQEEVPE